VRSGKYIARNSFRGLKLTLDRASDYWQKLLRNAGFAIEKARI
jgi:hypothetical protein